MIKQKTGKEKGFTLLELMIVIMLIGVIAAIALPGFQGWMIKNRLNGAARQVMTELMETRSKAVSRNNRFRVFFINDHQYTILDDRNNNNTVDTGEPTLTRDIHADYFDVHFTATANPIFYPRGTAFGTTVTLRNGAGGEKRVTVSTAGRVKIN